MSEQDTEQQEALIPDEGQAQEPELDVEELKAKAAKADEYKGFAERTAAENKELKRKLQPQDLKTNEASPIPEDRLERQDLRIEGYSRDEVDFLMQNGGQKALDNPIVMAGIEAMRKKAKSTEATPSGTGKSTVYQKYTEQDLRRMSAEELEKIIPQ